ncbi:FAD-binding oxidoreductase [Horticoccus luteus]|uniref:FAD-binding oxidoreductase n=1 Tax=Horticoccus luteus TaxID=2862869 RepID=A0A8F9TV17_9BACT|nr:FAD-dependent oxidoreductase [Horticoccus luteus]QYM78597.1 FAD-binding oxidoreductase [Horticoccus luteus]
MNLLSPHPFWPWQDGLPANFPALERNITCDVAVLGAGVTGALVAWHLADAGFDVVVLDAHEAAHGSTAGTTSLLQYEIDEPLHRLAHTFGAPFATRCYRRCDAALDGIARLVRTLKLSCDFERKSSLLLASTAAHVPRLRREFEARHAAGFDVEWWSRSILARRSTLPQPAALLSARAAQMDAYRFTYGLLQAAQQRGARIFDRTPVQRPRVHRRGADLRTAAGVRVRAREVVVATGYAADAWLPERATALHSTYALASEPLTQFAGWPADRCLIWETRRPYCYLRTAPDGRVIMGGYDEPFRDPAARDRLLPAKTAALRRRFAQLFPALPPLTVATSWAGTFGETPHGLPLIGRHPDRPRLWFAIGYGGNGITFSLIAAEIIRAAMLGDPDPDAPLFGFDRRPVAARP